jgi:hypothetical protein
MALRILGTASLPWHGTTTRREQAANDATLNRSHVLSQLRDTMEVPMARDVAARSKANSGVGLLALALGAAAVGAVAIGAVAIGRLAIGGLVIKKARFGALEVDELTVRKLRVVEQDGRQPQSG